MSTTSLHHNLATTIKLAPLLAPNLTQSLTILQMPILELSAWLQKQLEENPLVEITQEFLPLTVSRVIESNRVVEKRDLSKGENLLEYLESQARFFFHDPKDIEEALTLLGHLDDRGFLPIDTPDSSILKGLQSLDPPGICARSLQESLLLQLQQKGNQNSLAWIILTEHFQDLIHHRLSKIRKHLHCKEEELDEALHMEIASLSFNPASSFFISETILAIPDLFLVEEDGSWKVEINQCYLPRISLRHPAGLYRSKSRTSVDPQKALSVKSAFPIEDEQKLEIQKHLEQSYKKANELLQFVKKRSKTLRKLGDYLIKTQKAFLEGCVNQPNYLTIREVAHALKLHPATIARAVVHKQISCSHFGIIPLKFFFRRSQSASLNNNIKDIGEAITAIIAKENMPLSDEQIAEKLKTYGVVCARRTVSKYRKRCKIPSALIRKNKRYR